MAGLHTQAVGAVNGVEHPPRGAVPGLNAQVKGPEGRGNLSTALWAPPPAVIHDSTAREAHHPLEPPLVR